MHTLRCRKIRHWTPVAYLCTLRLCRVATMGLDTPHGGTSIGNYNIGGRKTHVTMRVGADHHRMDHITLIMGASWKLVYMGSEINMGYDSIFDPRQLNQVYSAFPLLVYTYHTQFFIHRQNSPRLTQALCLTLLFFRLLFFRSPPPGPQGGNTAA